MPKLFFELQLVAAWWVHFVSPLLGGGDAADSPGCCCVEDTELQRASSSSQVSLRQGTLQQTGRR